MERNSLTKKDFETLGRKFAELLLRNAKARPQDMPELVQYEEWTKANRYKRLAYSKAILATAREWLLMAGYDKETVTTVFDGKNI